MPSSPLSTRRIAVALWATLAVSTVFAGGLDALKDTTPQERATAQTLMMKQELGLTDAQAPKVAAIDEKYAEQMEPVIKGAQRPPMKMRTAKKIESQKEAELKRVLTPDQFAKFLAGKSEMRDELVDRIMEQRSHGSK